MGWPKKLQISLVAAGALALAVSANRLIAGLGDQKITPHIIIDGVDFGAFDKTLGIPNESWGEISNVTFERNFVTEPSLYMWARQAVTEHGKLRDIAIVYKNSEGVEVDKLLLKGSHPISWTVESSDPSQGGYHEKVEVSVQGFTFD
jgi:hypothetical protein